MEPNGARTGIDYIRGDTLVSNKRQAICYVLLVACRMRVTIHNKNLDITPALQLYVELKLLKPLRNLLKNILTGDMPLLDLGLGRNTRHHKKGKVYHVSANLSLDGHLLRAEVDDEDIRAACDILEEELERKISTWKNRKRSLMLRGSRRAKKDLRLHESARLFRQGRIRDEGN